MEVLFNGRICNLLAGLSGREVIEILGREDGVNWPLF